jgi:hypothetical protein
VSGALSALRAPAPRRPLVRVDRVRELSTRGECICRHAPTKGWGRGTLRGCRLQPVGTGTVTAPTGWASSTRVAGTVSGWPADPPARSASTEVDAHGADAARRQQVTCRIAATSRGSESDLAPADLVHRALVERDDEEVPVWSGFEVPKGHGSGGRALATRLRLLRRRAVAGGVADGPLWIHPAPARRRPHPSRPLVVPRSMGKK